MDATAASSSTTFGQLLGESDITCARLAAHLDALDTAERVRQCRDLSGKQMGRLYEIARDAEALTLEDIVGPNVADGATVRWAGKNSLPVHTKFEKHFARIDGKIVGMNVQALSFASGPGYYTCRAEGKKEVLFDYTDVPANAPPGWPAPRSNARGISNFVFKDLHDFNRRVSRDVMIGAATRLGKPMGDYYILARM